MPALAPNATTFASINPLNGEVVGEVPITPAGEVGAVVERARAAGKAWAAMTARERAETLKPAAARFAEEQGRLAELMTREMGKITREAISEASYIADSIPGSVDEMAAALEPTVLENETCVTTLYRDALGVAACITPWNFPLAMPHSQVLPALMAGNAVVLKPSEETPLCAQAYADILNEFLPEGVLQVVHGADEQGKALTASDVNLIVFTGSREVGKLIHNAASERLIRVILELGGKDPLVVLDGADVEAAAEYATMNTYRNCGQACISTERIYLQDGVADDFMKAFVKKVEALRIGDGLDEASDVGPMINAHQREHVIGQIDSAVKSGATIAVGGGDHPDAFVNPTVVDNVTHAMDIAREETFGPVATVTRVASVDEAVELANDTPFGLGAVVFGPEKTAYDVARRIDAGMIGVNQSIRGVGGTPWVGAKESGLGFHGSAEGHRQFAQVRVVSRPKA
ncbi:MAG: aldehyde dehydrogenase family protein [Phycisphaerales bacterium]